MRPCATSKQKSLVNYLWPHKNGTHLKSKKKKKKEKENEKWKKFKTTTSMKPNWHPSIGCFNIYGAYGPANNSTFNYVAFIFASDLEIVYHNQY